MKKESLRLFVAVLALFSLVAFAGGIFAPGVPVLLVFGYTVLGVLAFVGAVVVYLTLMQFILRHGGTDSRWFWFAADPPGLVRLRGQKRNDRD